MVSACLKHKPKWVNIPQMVLIIWMMTFCYLLWEDNYTFFLKPGFGFLIYAGLGICCLFVISGFFSTGPADGDKSFINGFIILLPVVFIFFSGNNTLGSYALSKRTLVMPAAEPAGKNEAGPESSLGETHGQTTDDVLKTTLSELIRKWNSFSGKKVALQGLFHKSVAGPDDKSALVFKYLISCCAADAQPIGIFIEREKVRGIDDNDWVEVTGVVNLQKLDGYDAVFMSLNRIEKVQKPSKTAAYIFF